MKLFTRIIFSILFVLVGCKTALSQYKLDCRESIFLQSYGKISKDILHKRKNIQAHIYEKAEGYTSKGLKYYKSIILEPDSKVRKIQLLYNKNGYLMEALPLSPDTMWRSTSGIRYFMEKSDIERLNGGPVRLMESNRNNYIIAVMNNKFSYRNCSLLLHIKLKKNGSLLEQNTFKSINDVLKNNIIDSANSMFDGFSFTVRGIYLSFDN